MLPQALLEMSGPVAIRYPRGGEGAYRQCHTEDAAVLQEGSDLTVVCYGTMINEVLAAQEELEPYGVRLEIIKLGRIDRLDMETIAQSVQKTKHLLVAEEVCAAGCVGTRLLALCEERKIVLKKAQLINLRDGIVPHGTVNELRALYALDKTGIAYTVLTMLEQLNDTENYEGKV